MAGCRSGQLTVDSHSALLKMPLNLHRTSGRSDRNKRPLSGESAKLHGKEPLRSNENVSGKREKSRNELLGRKRRGWSVTRKKEPLHEAVLEAFEAPERQCEGCEGPHRHLLDQVCTHISGPGDTS